MMGIYIVTLIFLIPCSVWDVRTRRVPIWWLATGCMAGIAVSLGLIVTGEALIWNLAFAISPGVFLIALSIVTEQQVGMGDGICALILGFLLGIPEIYAALIIALLLSSIYAGMLLITRRGSRRTRMPWIPFMTMGVVTVIVQRITG